LFHVGTFGRRASRRPGAGRHPAGERVWATSSSGSVETGPEKPVGDARIIGLPGVVVDGGVLPWSEEPSRQGSAPGMIAQDEGWDGPPPRKAEDSPGPRSTVPGPACPTVLAPGGAPSDPEAAGTARLGTAAFPEDAEQRGEQGDPRRARLKTDGG